MALVDQDGKLIGTGVVEYRIGSIVMPTDGNAKSWQAMAPRNVPVSVDMPISPLFIAMWIATSEHLAAHQEEIVLLKKELVALRAEVKGVPVPVGDA